MQTATIMTSRHGTLELTWSKRNHANTRKHTIHALASKAATSAVRYPRRPGMMLSID